MWETTKRILDIKAVRAAVPEAEEAEKEGENAVRNLSKLTEMLGNHMSGIGECTFTLCAWASVVV